MYEGEDHTYKFQAPSEDERDEWIQVIHTASYECLKMQLQSLREQIQAKTGRDPITQPPPTEFGMEYETQSQGTHADMIHYFLKFFSIEQFHKYLLKLVHQGRHWWIL